jgi:cell fate regulator YaaT (PSP1 superfamily)
MSEIIEGDVFEADIEDLSREDLAALEDSEGTENAAQTIVYTEPLYRLKLEYSVESLYATSPDGIELAANDFVVIPTRYGLDIATVRGLTTKPVGVPESSIVTIERKATDAEIKRLATLKAKEKEAFQIFTDKTARHGLVMKLITTHCLYDESKMLFFFSSENRIDFRELVKDLVGIFRMRIELRQIGARDEARITGGLGACGRCLCCSTVSDKMRPVTIKMAKEQELSLNSMKISGQCGRLLCCLSYEYDWYVDARKNLPPEGLPIHYDGADFRVTSLNLLTREVQISGADGRVLEIPASRFSQSGGKWRIE